MKNIFILLALLILPNCSTVNVMKQAGPAHLEGIDITTSRAQLISKIGYPVHQDTVDKKTEYFSFYDGPPEISKFRVIPYLAADVFSLFLSELIIWPIEMHVTSTQKCVGIATYDDKLMVKTWIAHKASDSLERCDT